MDSGGAKLLSNVIEDQLIEARVDEIRSSRDHGITAVFDAGEIGELVTGKPKLISNEGDMVTIISTEDGEPRQIPSMMLAKTLKKRRNGKRAFEMVDPETGRTTGPVPSFLGGTTPCMFNPKSEKFADLQTVPGLAGFVCQSEKLASEFDAEMHAKNRHTRRFQVAQDYFARKEREEERNLQRQSIEAMLKMAGGKRAIYECDSCERFFDTEQGLAVHKGRDHKGE
jgi:hypothetical protein